MKYSSIKLFAHMNLNILSSTIILIVQIYGIECDKSLHVYNI
jgi:hypothetical protein